MRRFNQHAWDLQIFSLGECLVEPRLHSLRFVAGEALYLRGRICSFLLYLLIILLEILIYEIDRVEINRYLVEFFKQGLVHLLKISLGQTSFH